MNNCLNIFRNKTVLITGHTGFKGTWLSICLKMLGANIVGIALDPPTTPSFYEISGLSKSITDIRLDIRDRVAIEDALHKIQPDFVFHLAAQSLVGKSYEYPVDTWDTNVCGTVHVLNALRTLKNKCTAIFITSDKCYENVEWIWGYKETDRLGGKDPYSASKASAEIAIKSYVDSYFSPNESNGVRIASARAGNVIGGGDWSQGRVIPDCIESWVGNERVLIRNPNSTRPWQHVLEPLSGYLKLASYLASNLSLHGQSFNFGPNLNQVYSVGDLVGRMANIWGGTADYSFAANNNGQNFESNLLKLNCEKAHLMLEWNSALTFSETVEFTAIWYKKYYENNSNIVKFTNDQIVSYFDMVDLLDKKNA
jgi:CDP-glucose 4,6-dehydratase